MNKIWILVIGITVTIAFSGCVNKVTTVSTKSTYQLINDKNSSYIIFSRPKIMGYAVTNNIVEFFTDSDRLVLVSALRANSKVIYKVAPGEHYFYMGGGENDDMLKIDADPGRIYYVYTEIGIGLVAARFYFKPFRYKSITLKASLLNKPCDDQLLKKYQFNKVEDEYDYASANTFESTLIGLTIQCNDNYISSTNYIDMSHTILNRPRLLEINENSESYLNEISGDYKKEIAEDYPEWAKNNYGENMMVKEDGIPMEEVVGF